MTMETEETHKLISWVYEYLRKATDSKIRAIVGLSGGVDSAVIATICAKAVGATRTLGVILPCESGIEDTFDALLVAQSLGIHTVDMDLENTFRSWWDTYRFSLAWPAQQNELFPPMNKMVRANVKARLRMLSLYAIANQTGGLVIGTTNKSEALIGYSTKYGDAGVDIEPLMDFYKTEVWEIAEYLKIPARIISKEPSAGLWDGQTDKEELGLSYQEIDTILKSIVEQVHPVKRPNEQYYKKIQDMMAAAGHKNIGLPYFKRNN